MNGELGSKRGRYCVRKATRNIKEKKVERPISMNHRLGRRGKTETKDGITQRKKIKEVGKQKNARKKDRKAPGRPARKPTPKN